MAHLLAGRTATPAVSILRCTAAALVALLVLLGVAELVAVPVGPAGAPTLAIGEVAIAHTPNSVKDFAIAHFGEHDKAVLVIGIYLVLALVAVAVGAATGALRSRPAHLRCSPLPPAHLRCSPRRHGHRRPRGGTLGSAVGVPPYITPNADFYRVDTALVVPKLRTEGYTLRLHGLVDRPVTWTYQELLRMPSPSRR